MNLKPRKGQEVCVAWVVLPSNTFEGFISEANTFDPERPEAFEAKQRMIDRAEAFAIHEVYGLSWVRLWLPWQMKRFYEGLSAAAYDSIPEAADASVRHRAEIRLNLYSRTIQQFIQRRQVTVASAAAVAAVVVGAVATCLAYLTVICH